MADQKRTHSRLRKKAYQRVLKFPQAKGKVITEARLSVSPDYYLVEMRFGDKTALHFDLEPCVRVSPELVDWKTGNYKLLKRWRPVYSTSSRV